ECDSDGTPIYIARKMPGGLDREPPHVYGLRRCACSCSLPRFQRRVSVIPCGRDWREEPCTANVAVVAAARILPSGVSLGGHGMQPARAGARDRGSKARSTGAPARIASNISRRLRKLILKDPRISRLIAPSWPAIHWRSPSTKWERRTRRARSPILASLDGSRAKRG